MPPMKAAFATVTRPSDRMNRTEEALEQTPARTAGQPASRIAWATRPLWTTAIIPPTIAAAPIERYRMMCQLVACWMRRTRRPARLQKNVAPSASAWPRTRLERGSSPGPGSAPRSDGVPGPVASAIAWPRR